MKIKRFATFTWLTLSVACVSLFAQSTTPTDLSRFPSGDAAWLALIPPLTGLITWAVGKIPPLPKQILPWITPVLGIGIGEGLRLLGTAHISPVLTGAAGTVAVFLYEAIKGAVVSQENPADSIITPTAKPKKQPELKPKHPE